MLHSLKVAYVFLLEGLVFAASGNARDCHRASTRGWRRLPVYRQPIHYFTDDARQLVILFDYLVPMIERSQHPIDFAKLLRVHHAAIAARRGLRPSFAKSTLK
jgi:hypothetical protein